MSLRTKTWTRFQLLRDYPVDLAAVSAAAILAYYIVSIMPAGSEFRMGVAMGLVLFLPGYALVAMIFPAAARQPSQRESDGADRRFRGIGTVERLGLSLVLSLAIVPVVIMVLAGTSWGLSTEVVTAVLAGVIVVCSQIAVVRRLRIPAPNRFSVTPLDSIRRRTADTGGAKKLASSVILWGAILLAVSGLLFAFVSPIAAGGFTELGLYTENDDGDLVTGEIPGEVGPGESISITFSIENGEGEEMAYTLVVQEQHIEDGEITDRTELRELTANVSDGTTVSGERDITPTAEEGESVRISVLLYEGDPPAEPTTENAAEETHFWVDITEEAAEGETASDSAEDDGADDASEDDELDEVGDIDVEDGTDGEDGEDGEDGDSTIDFDEFFGDG